MTTYKAKLTQIASGTFEVEADSPEQARRKLKYKAQRAWRSTNSDYFVDIESDTEPLDESVLDDIKSIDE